MAVQAGNSVTPISPQVISGAFVQQYYHILHETPDQVHRFYQDASIVGRPNSTGVMEYVSTTADINRMILSMDFSNYLTEIETADAQLSHKDGVLIVVTGSLTSEGICRRFAQSFFLAPQESGGYVVLNDIFRFIVERPPVAINQITQENENNQNAASLAETDPNPAEDGMVSDPVAVENNFADGEVTNSTLDGTSVENNATVESPEQMSKEEEPRKTPVAAPTPTSQKDVTKKSYASIVMKEVPLTPVAKPKPAPKPVIKTAEASEKPSVKSTQTVEITPNDDNVAENNTSNDEQGYSVFVKSLPYNVTVQMVEEEFKKFGAIKPSGIQVRNNKIDRFCFGFIEFESQQSMKAAIEASPILMGGKEVFVEEKRTTTRVVNGVVITRGDNGNGGGGGRFQSGRGAFRGDNFRGRGGGYANNANYHGGDNFNRRSDLRNRTEFSGRGRGPPPGNGYQQNGFHPARPFQNGNGRFTRVNNSPRQTPVAA
ncbi:nuclear transport factor 2-like isoform X2 [Oryza brachyantha]|uniref:nuclear transport factor 2-like isoform X2 n=1 Tax=Oryza brachyantha TaxID=4533 RepID=UPI001AD98D7C|nr:nuclear transport factor 2-like isoform X2 [Oryza brachyantha]